MFLQRFAIKLATPVENLEKRFLRERLYIVGLQSSFLSCDVFKPDVARLFCLISLGVTNHPWEIVGLDLVTGLYGPEFHFATIIDLCLIAI